MGSTEHIDKALEALDKRYQQEREALLAARDVMSRLELKTEGKSSQGAKAPRSPSPTSESSKKVTDGKVSPVEGHAFDSLSNRDIVREMVLKQDGEFTLHDLVEQTWQIPSSKAQNLDRMVWSSALWQFAQQGLLEEVQKRKGNKPAIYRRLTDDLNPPPNKAVSEFPLTQMVLEAVSELTQSVFGRNEVLEKVLEMHPEHANRVRADTVGAILNRESQHTRSNFRMIERSPTGNLYERK